MNRSTARDIERAALQMREAARRLMAEADVLATAGSLAPHRVPDTMIKDAARLDAFTALLSGGMQLPEAVEEVMVRGFRPVCEDEALAAQL